MRKPLKPLSLLTVFIMCFSICGCGSNEKDSSKTEIITETTTEVATEMITENQCELDVAVSFDENISYKINSNYSELEKTVDSHSYFTGPPDWGMLTISNISDSNYKYTNDDLIGFVEDLKTKEKITDYNYAKSDSFDYICAYGKGPINYYFIVNGNLYSVIFEHPSSDINDRTNFIESITVNKAGSAKEKPTELPTEKKNEPQTEEPTQEPTEELIESPTDEPTEEETEPEVITHDYVINYNTGKFHKPSCYTIKDAYNLGDYNGTKDELLDQGYAACKKCKPY